MVAHFTGRSTMSEQKVPANNDATTDAGADSDVDEIIESFAGPKNPLADGSRIGIVAELNVEMSGFFEDGSEWCVLKSRNIGHGKDEPCKWVKWPRHANADAIKFGASWELGMDLFDKRDNTTDNCLGALLDTGINLGVIDDCAVGGY
jgi:hypothetical protein